jgi:hypothetical protein
MLVDRKNVAHSLLLRCLCSFRLQSWTRQTPMTPNVPKVAYTAGRNVTLGHLTLFYSTPDLRLACRTQ